MPPRFPMGSYRYRALAVTEEQAIERITDALMPIGVAKQGPFTREWARKRAEAAWNEIKAIARESNAGPKSLPGVMPMHAMVDRAHEVDAKHGTSASAVFRL